MGGVMDSVTDFITGGDDTSGSQTTTNTPATLSADEQKIFDAYVDALFGVDEEAFDADWYLKKYPDVAQGWAGSAYDHYLRYGKNEGRYPNAVAAGEAEPTPGYLERLKEDKAYRDKLVDEYIASIEKEKQAYNEALSPINLQFGDWGKGETPFRMSYIPPKQAKVAGDRLSANLMTAGLMEQLKESQAPNTALNEYMKYLQGPAMQLAGLRYGLPSATSTVDLPERNWLSKLGDIVGVAKSIYHFKD